MGPPATWAAMCLSFLLCRVQYNLSNGDGVLSVDEFISAWTALGLIPSREPPPPPAPPAGATRGSRVWTSPDPVAPPLAGIDEDAPPAETGSREDTPVVPSTLEPDEAEEVALADADGGPDEEGSDAFGDAAGYDFAFDMRHPLAAGGMGLGFEDEHRDHRPLGRQSVANLSAATGPAGLDGDKWVGLGESVGREGGAAEEDAERRARGPRGGVEWRAGGAGQSGLDARASRGSRERES